MNTGSHLNTPATALHLVVVSAGTGRPSSTRLLADRLDQATSAQLEQAGRPVRTTVVELRELATEIAHHLVTGFPGAHLRAALDALTEADGVIAVSPIYTASYSGLFKSFFDVLEPTVLEGKPTLIAATGGTARHSLALEYAMRPLFAYLRAAVVPTAVFASSEDWGGGGDAQTEGLSSRVRRASGELAGLLAGRDAAGGRGGTGGADGDGAERDESEVVPFAEQLAAVRGG